MSYLQAIIVARSLEEHFRRKALSPAERAWEDRIQAGEMKKLTEEFEREQRFYIKCLKGMVLVAGFSLLALLILVVTK